MLSVAKLTLGQEAYYEQQVAAGLDDYYAGRGESPGLWAGSGAGGLGLAGIVEDGDLGTLLRGVDPAGRERLRAPVRERTITVRTLDLESGQWRVEPKRLAPVSGYDLVFSCPKSVSLLHALTADKRVLHAIDEAHDSAWQAALAYLEREACVVRRGRGGAIREHGGGFAAAAFRHRTSRAQDPHLHTHVIVANMARAADGEWRALDGEAILKTYRLAAGYLYEAQLRHELKGKAILVGDPQQLPAVGAGGLYPALCERLGAINLTDNRRQRDLSERQALAQLRVGEPEPYLAYAARRGRLHVAEDPTLAKQALLEDWWRLAQHDLDGTVMLAYRLDDVRDLNDAARTLLIRSGRLGSETLALGEREFQVGDRVICRRNDTRLGIRNGMRATIVDLDTAALTLRTDSGLLRSINAAYAAEHLEHGYALTGHAAQGASVDRAFVLFRGEGALQEWGYVACTRARTETRVYLAPQTREREAHGREPAGPSAPERLARALTTSASESLAVEQASGTSDATARLFAARQRHLEQVRTRAAQRLAKAEAKLDQLGWRDRRRQGAEIRNEIALQRTTLRLADEKLAQPVPASRSQLVPADRDRAAPARDHGQRRRPMGERLQRPRAAERGRGIELEL